MVFDQHDVAVKRLVGVATQTIERLFAIGRHHVACALMTRRGAIYTGVHLDCAGFDNCAEPVAIANACLAGDADLSLIVAVMKAPGEDDVRVVNPCGNCLQHLLVFGPYVEVIASVDGRQRRLTLPELLPYPYGR